MKMWNIEEEIKWTVFNWSDNVSDTPQFEKFVIRVQDQISKNIQDYIFIWITCSWINGPRSTKLLTLINDCSEIIKRIDGVIIYEKQEIEEDYNIYIHQPQNIFNSPRAIWLALPFKPGNNIFNY